MLTENQAQKETNLRHTNQPRRDAITEIFRLDLSRLAHYL